MVLSLEAIVDADRALTEIVALCHTMDASVRDRVEVAARDLHTAYAQAAEENEALRTWASGAQMHLEESAALVDSLRGVLRG